MTVTAADVGQALVIETGVLSGGLRVPNAAAPIEVITDLRAGRIRCSMTVDSPTTGRPATRLNWLLRQLRESKGQVCVEVIAARHRGKGPVRTLAELRENPKHALDDQARELRAFTVSLSANAGTKRGKASGSFVTSALDSVDTFYAEVVQHIKPWASPPVKIHEDESQAADSPGVPEQVMSSLRDMAEASVD